MGLQKVMGLFCGLEISESETERRSKHSFFSVTFRTTLGVSTWSSSSGIRNLLDTLWWGDATFA